MQAYITLQEPNLTAENAASERLNIQKWVVLSTLRGLFIALHFSQYNHLK
jgi:hypothetical protein